MTENSWFQSIANIYTYFNKPRSADDISAVAFATLCENASTIDDLEEIVRQLCAGIQKEVSAANASVNGTQVYWWLPSAYHTSYNKYIGWGVPSETVLSTISEAFKNHKAKFPTTRLVDLGAGTGLYCRL